MLNQRSGLPTLSEDILEKEVIVKEVVLEVAKVGRDSGFELIFSGGTSLSQGWGVIERISEDVDFRVIAPSFSSKNSKSKALSGLKAELGRALRGAGFEIDGEIVGRDGNRYIRANVVYESAFTADTPSLRPYVKVELMGVDRPFSIESREVQSILERHEVGDQSTAQSIPMVSLPDIVSDKVISYLRRTAEHKANPELAHRYDPRLVRHLYDVHRIVDANPSVIVEAAPIFAETLTQEIQQYGGERFPVFKERPLSVLRDELDLLAIDAEARNNYAVFVNDLVYGSKPSFDEVSQTFRMVATDFLTVAAKPSLSEQPQQMIGGSGHGFARRL
ncbi:MAG: nucleotidyl transferase AbiEii/AbiGii toxin family protein [Ferrimicrobium sp.]